MRRFSIFTLIFLLLPHGNANAGAWVKAPKNGEIIVSNYNPQTESELKTELDFYGEYGLNDNNSAIISGAYSKYGNSNYGYVSNIGIKHLFYSKDNLVLSTQLSALFNQIDIYHNPQTKYELRFLAGKNFGNGFWINSEIGFRTPNNNEKIAYELAIGKNMPNGGNIILKYLRDDFAISQSVEKVQFSIVRPLKNNWFFEVGLRHDFGGYDLKENNGLMTGIWFRF